MFTLRTKLRALSLVCQSFLVFKKNVVSICVVELMLGFLYPSLEAYQLPSGIPDPGAWGNTHPISSSAPEITSKCPNWPNAATTNCYYIDNTHGASTDSSNTYGHPDKPRKTIPGNYSAGAYVELHGGPYVSTAQLIISANGTEDEPVWIRGTSSHRPTIRQQVIVHGSYVIIEYLNFDQQLKTINFRSKTTNGITSTVHHGCLRNSTFSGDGTRAASSANVVGIFGSVGYEVSDVIIYNNEMHDFGDVSFGTTENDYHGIKPQSYCHNVWVLNNRGRNLAGDMVQVGDASLVEAARPYNIYIGGNSCNGNLEDGVDIKQCSNIVISDNIFYNNQGSGVIIHNNPKTLWVINNVIHNVTSGIVTSGAESVSILGNIVYDIHRTIGTDPNTIWTDGVAIKAYSSSGVSIIGNTIWDYSKGIALGATLTTTPSYAVQNNLFGERSDIDSHDLIFDSKSIFISSLLSNNIFYYTQLFSVSVSGVKYTSINQLQSEGKCSNCKYDTVVSVVNPASGDFHLVENSSAVDAGMNLSIYDEYPFGSAIKLDRDGIARPVNGAWDVGAYELKGLLRPVIKGINVLN